MIRVLHFFKTYWPETFGGIERTIDTIARGTSAHGVASSVLTLSNDSSTPLRHFNGYEVHVAKRDFEIASTGFSRKVFARFSELAAQADIVHYHFPWPLMDIAHFWDGHRKPSVVTYHADVVKQRMLLRAYQPLMNRFLGDVDRIVATSPNYLQSSPVLNKFRHKVSTIPIGLDESAYPRVHEAKLAEWRSRLPDRFLLFVGVLRHYKGLSLLIDAARQAGVPVVIAGKGGREKEFRSLADDLSPGIVTFTGAINEEDKVALLSLCRGVVMPSQVRAEAYGLLLVEACMFGRPMITCELGTGTSYVNCNGVTGFVVPPGSASDIAVAMKRLHDDDRLAAEMGASARSHFEKSLSSQMMSISYARLYRELREHPSDTP